MSDEIKTLIAVVGPTAVGKTAVGITLARHFNTEIISADSRQFYREMSIGTAKPSMEELSSAKHHFINSHSIQEEFNVGRFEQEGLALLDQLFKSHNPVTMVGGSGLYIKAICEGFDDLPPVDASIRASLNAQLDELGLAHLQNRLKSADSVYYQQVDLNNPQRVIRALEVFESTGKPFSSYHNQGKNKRPFNIIKIGLNMPRELLYERINARVDQMLADGLLEEVKALQPYQHLNALNTVGYSEIFSFLNNLTNYETAVAMIKQNTRRFAKRQLTWFRKDKEVRWFEPHQLDEMIQEINANME